MTTKILTGAYPGGYTLSASYTGLIIDQTASVGGHGVYVGFTAAVTNLGMVMANDKYTGILLKAGGTVTNGSATDIRACRVLAESGFPNQERSDSRSMLG
ncbi:MAG: hypothetical protein M3T55_02790 [Pseudomonadota bacterium]|nr:hypothetical protein [Pseudomonadota bacterium]